MTSPTPEPLRRFCPVCKQVDDHPRHDFWLTDPAVAPHLDCCADKGCPDGSCPIIVETSKGKRRGGEFGEQIGKDAEKIQAALDKRDEATKHFTLGDLRPEIHGAVIAQPTIVQGANQ